MAFIKFSALYQVACRWTTVKDAGLKTDVKVCQTVRQFFSLFTKADTKRLL